MERHFQEVCEKALNGFFKSPKDFIRELLATESTDRALTWAGFYLKSKFDESLLKNILFFNLQIPSHFVPSKAEDELMYPVALLSEYQREVYNLHEPVIGEMGAYRKKKLKHNWIGLSDIIDNWKDKIDNTNIHPQYFIILLKNSESLATRILEHKFFIEGKAVFIYQNQADKKFYLRVSHLKEEIDIEKVFYTKEYNKFWIEDWINEYQQRTDYNNDVDLEGKLAYYLGIRGGILPTGPLRDWIGLSKEANLDSVSLVEEINYSLSREPLFIQALRACTKYHKIPEISDAISFYLIPWVDNWGFKWHENPYHNSAKNTNEFSKWLGLPHDQVDADSSKGLLIYVQEKEDISTKKRAYPVKIKVLESLLKKLGMEKLKILVDQEQPIYFPVTPAFPFLISLSELYHEIMPTEVILRKTKSLTKEIITLNNGSGTQTSYYEGYFLTFNLQSEFDPLGLYNGYKKGKKTGKSEFLSNFYSCKTKLLERGGEPFDLFEKGMGSPYIGLRFLPHEICAFWTKG